MPDGRGPASWGVWGDPATWAGARNAALKAAAMIALSVVAPEAMLAIAVDMALADALMRALHGQTAGQILGGTLADVSGVNGVYSGLTGHDIATGQDLHMTAEQRGEALAGGLVGVTMLGVGGAMFLGDLAGVGEAGGGAGAMAAAADGAAGSEEEAGELAADRPGMSTCAEN